MGTQKNLDAVEKKYPEDSGIVEGASAVDLYLALSVNFTADFN